LGGGIIMSFKKFISAALLSVMLFSIAGCANKNIEVNIKPEINKYSPMMSSTPGIPLTAEFNSEEKPDNIKYHWVTEQGVFLDWNSDTGKISTLGKDAKLDEKKIYWTVDLEKEIDKLPFKVYLKVEDENSSKVIGETSIQIVQDKEGFFSVKE
jgi:hypothetical protein